mmetsp:Transcript_28338/g.51759  ORF Transcript_28338/g.51759 Transcript_28338/m.51759 type:complete len:204 (+) Transcript_28338:88-699(+)
MWLSPPLTGCCRHIHLKVLVNQNHIIQGLSGRHHGQTWCPLNPGVEQHWFIVVIFQKLAHLFRQFLLVVAVQTLDPKRARQGGILRTFVTHSNVPFIVEETLPVLNHHLRFVVEDEELNRYLLFADGLEFCEGHIERSVTVDGDAYFSGIGELGSHAVAKTDAHGTKGARGEHLTRLRPCDKLSGGHLVDAHTGGEDGLVDLA